jgi:hypothetical protein
MLITDHLITSRAQRKQTISVAQQEALVYREVPGRLMSKGAQRVILQRQRTRLCPFADAAGLVKPRPHDGATWGAPPKIWHRSGCRTDRPLQAHAVTHPLHLSQTPPWARACLRGAPPVQREHKEGVRM